MWRQLLLKMQPEVRHHCAPIERRPFARLDDYLDVLARDWIRHTNRLCPQHVGMQQCDTLDFAGEDLQPSDVHNLFRASDDLDEIAILLDDIPRIVPSVDEWRWRIEVPEHAVLRPDVEYSVDNPGLEPFPPYAHPQAVARSGFHLEHAELREAVRLPEVDAGKLCAQAVESALIHPLGAVGDDAQVRKLETVEHSCKQHHPQECRRRREQLDSMKNHLGGYHFGRAVRRDDDNALVEERVEHGVDAAGVIEQKKVQRPHGRTLLRIALEEIGEVV